MRVQVQATLIADRNDVRTMGSRQLSRTAILRGGFTAMAAAQGIVFVNTDTYSSEFTVLEGGRRVGGSLSRSRR